MSGKKESFCDDCSTNFCEWFFKLHCQKCHESAQNSKEEKWFEIPNTALSARIAILGVLHMKHGFRA